MKCYWKLVNLSTIIVIFYFCYCFDCSTVSGANRDLVNLKNVDRVQLATKIGSLAGNIPGLRTDLELDSVEGRKKVQGRLFFKMIKRFIRRNLLKVLLAALLAIGVIKLLITFVLPFFFGVHTAKKVFLKILLFFIPAAGYLFKLCSAYDGDNSKTKFHKHHHFISQPSLPVPPLHKPYVSPIHLHQPYYEIANQPYSHSHHHSSSLPRPIGPYLYGNFKDPDKFKNFFPDEHTDAESYDSYQPFELEEFDAEKWPDKELDLSLDLKDEMDLDRYDTKDQNEISKHLPDSLTSQDFSYNHNFYTNPKPVIKPKKPNFPTHKNNLQYADPNMQMYTQKLIETLKKQRNRFAETKSQQYEIKQNPNSNKSQDPEYDEFEEGEDNRQNQTQQQQESNLANRNSNRNINSNNLKTFDEPYYGPIMEKIDDIFRKIGLNEENCRKRLICSMYKSPEIFSPYSNYVSHQLSRSNFCRISKEYNFR